VPAGAGTPLVTVLDVGLPAGNLPSVLSHCLAPAGAAAYAGPDEDGDGFLDRVAGHGMFVAGVVAQVDPQTVIEVVPAMDNLGSAEESVVARILDGLVGKTSIVNMSFSGYAMHRMGCLARAVRRFQFLPLGYPNPKRPASRRDGGVVVASAGNDGTWWAPYPAILPGVVGVAALGPDGPAPFTNAGPWVRACAAGVDVRSSFFLPESWTVTENGVAVRKEGKELPTPEGDPDLFEGAALWSGTSFAAPLVAGRLARLVREGPMMPKDAVGQLIEAPGLAGLPWLGTIVTA
jgi:subtilisin family serine protease